jgi:hypothetical protein
VPKAQKKKYMSTGEQVLARFDIALSRVWTLQELSAPPTCEEDIEHQCQVCASCLTGSLVASTCSSEIVVSSF